MGMNLSPAVVGAHRFRRILGLHVLGSVLGGAALGLAAGTLGLLARTAAPRSIPAVVAGTAIGAYAVSELLPLRLWRPDGGWQVPERLRRTPYVGAVALLWGVGLGFGWLTKNVTSALLMFVLASLTVSPAVAMIGAVLFGLTRGLTLLLGSGSRDFGEAMLKLERIRRRYARAPRVGTALVGVVLAAALISAI